MFIKYIIKIIYIMSSTRNINTRGNYELQQRQFNGTNQYSLYTNSQYGEAYNTHLAGVGLLQGYMPWNKLSANPVETESFLFGINSTNLVNPAPNFHAEPLLQSHIHLYNPNPTIMPNPLVIEKNRPFP
jgi:hypothetical protein